MGDGAGVYVMVMLLFFGRWATQILADVIGDASLKAKILNVVRYDNALGKDLERYLTEPSPSRQVLPAIYYRSLHLLPSRHIKYPYPLPTTYHLPPTTI